MNSKLKVLDLFAGIGGFALGLDSTGFFETVKFVEKDKYCQKVLRKNFPNIPIEEDIKNVKGKEFEADVITGGFPCQPMSVAGKRKGTDDDRYLWPEMFRLIREIKPEFVIGENVQGIINIQNGMVLRQVQDDLESEGFEVQCFLIPASGIGAWHQRYRVWIVAHSQHNGLLRAVARVDEEKNKVEEKHRKENSSTGKSIGASSIWKTDNGHENVSNTKIIRTGEPRNIDQEKGNQSSSSTQFNSSSEDVSDTSSKRLQRRDPERELQEQEFGFSSNQNDETKQTWWQTQSKLCGVPNGISYELDKDRANRIKTLGNAIVPQIARELGLAIKKILIEEDKQ